MKTKSILLKVVAFSSLLAVAACSSVSDNGASTHKTMSVQFRADSGTQTAPKTVPTQSAVSGDSLVIEGSNGTLVLDDVHFVAEKFKLEQDGVVCSDSSATDTEGDHEDDGCEEFKTNPQFVDLPLDGSALQAVQDSVPAGVYTKLKFEINDIAFGEDEEQEHQAHQALIDEIKSQFPDWPNESSMYVEGYFKPANGDSARAFRVYAEAEIKIEMEFNPPITVDQTTAAKDLTINVDPKAWFKNTDGSVYDLSEFDYDQTGRVLEFEMKAHDGFTKVEAEDDHSED